MEQKPARRGRPPAYDRDEVVDKAQALFWKEGASGVSVDELSAVTGLHKPSLYAAFGGKPGLYLASLDAYIERGAPDISGALATKPLSAALRAFFEADLDVFCAGGARRGCFLIGTAIEAAADDADVGERVEAVFAGLRRTLHARLETAIDDGDLGKDASLDALLEIIFGTHVALAVAARAGSTKSELRKRYESVVRLFESFERRG